MRIALFYVLLLCCFIVTAAQPKKCSKIEISTDKEIPLYQKDEPIVFNISMVGPDGKTVIGREIGYHIRLDGTEDIKGTFISAKEPFQIKTALSKPGFAVCTAGIYDKKGRLMRNEADNGYLLKWRGAAYNPAAIRNGKEEPGDFDAFWKAKKEAVLFNGIKAKLSPVPLNDKFDCYDVQIPCPEGAPVSGYLTVPKKAAPGTLPAIVYFHGAGVRSARIRTHPGMLTFDINAHGVPNGKESEYYQKLQKDGLAGNVHKWKKDKDKFVLLNMFQRVYMALQYIKSRPEWDHKTLIAYGHSQGGGQALIAGGIDNDVTLTVAMEPAFCDHHGYLKGQACGWPNLTNNGKHTPEAVVNTIGYFDAVHFAKRIKGQALLIAGFGDYICSPTGVYAAYNNINCKKQMIDDYYGGHWATSESRRLVWPVVEKHLKR